MLLISVVIDYLPFLVVVVLVVVVVVVLDGVDLVVVVLVVVVLVVVDFVFGGHIFFKIPNKLSVVCEEEQTAFGLPERHFEYFLSIMHRLT